MHAFVFAAGRGTRLRPDTDETPKPLLDIGNKSLLERCLRTVVDAGIDEIVIVVGYRSNEIVDAIGESFGGVPVTYAHQTERKGLAHAVRRAFEDGYGLSLESTEPPDSLPNRFPNDVMTVNGDNVFDGCDLGRLRERHTNPSVDGTLLVDRVSRNEAESTARLDRTPDGVVRGIESTVTGGETGAKPAEIAAGVQTHDGRSLLESCLRVDRAQSGEYELTDALERLVRTGSRYVGVEADGWHLNVNTPADLETARDRFDDAS
ncbi:sugar phosphate nucleotidyltransferase [Natrialbaceae archaeon A-arb3/5]